MKKKKIVIAVALLAVAAVGIKAFAGMNSNKETGVQVLAGTAQKKDIEELLTLKAPLEGTESIDVVSRLHYEITSIYVKEGDRVKAGQVIAELDPKDLEEEIEKLRDNLELLRIQYNETNAKISDDYNNAEKKPNKTLED